jgi:hypothetical protein
VIAETGRLRRDLAVIDADTDLVRNLAVLTGHRADLIADRVRMINRMRDLMTSVFPSLERAFDYSSHKGAPVPFRDSARNRWPLAGQLMGTSGGGRRVQRRVQ